MFARHRIGHKADKTGYFRFEKQTITLILALFFCGCSSTYQWMPQDVTMTFASIPAQVCIAVNSQRNVILTELGDQIYQKMLDGEITEDEARNQTQAVHELDDSLRLIVSPAYESDERVVRGACRNITEALEILARDIDEFTDFDNEEIVDVMSTILNTMRYVIVILSDLGIEDVTEFLDGVYPIGNSGLGQMLETFMELADSFLANGSEALHRGTR